MIHVCKKKIHIDIPVFICAYKKDWKRVHQNINNWM